MSFNPTARMYYESRARQDDYSGDLVNELRKLDSQSAEIRAQGGDPRDMLSDQIQALTGAVARAQGQRIEQLKAHLDMARNRYQEDREKHAEREILKQNDARARIAALDDSEIADLARSYLNGEDLPLYELRELKGRLRSIPDLEAEHQTLRSEMTRRNAEAPWLQEPETAAQLQERESLESIPPGRVSFSADDQSFTVPVADLIDHAGELNQTATFR